MKKISMLMVFCFLLGLFTFLAVLYAENVQTLLVWDPVTTFEDGTPIPEGTVIGYIVYSGATESTMTEKARTSKSVIPVSQLNLSKQDVWLGVVASSVQHLDSMMTTIKTMRVSSVLKLNLIHEVSE